jgi:hypothetical protein
MTSTSNPSQTHLISTFGGRTQREEYPEQKEEDSTGWSSIPSGTFRKKETGKSSTILQNQHSR